MFPAISRGRSKLQLLQLLQLPTRTPLPQPLPRLQQLLLPRLLPKLLFKLPPLLIALHLFNASAAHALGSAHYPAQPLTLPLSERHSLLHSHNDYEQKRPLNNALDQHFDSVEADIWLNDDRLKISHIGLFFQGTLEEMYLNPLQKRVQELGSVYGDGRPFYLWIDIKSADKDLVPILANILERYPMLTQFTDSEVLEGPVTVILTGNEDRKKDYVNHYALRRATRDSNQIKYTDPPADNRWTWYAIDWAQYFSDDGNKNLSTRQRKRLFEMVAFAHQQGRKIRFWNTPDAEKIWNEEFFAQVDLIGANHLKHLARHARE